jgi:hypothetical protein
VSVEASFLSSPWKIDPVWTIHDFCEERSKIILDPIFQRGDVWPSEKQRLLIDSILKGWEIGRILLNAISVKCEKNMFKPLYQVVDGQQRLRSIYRFLDGEISIPEWTLRADTAGIYIISEKKYDLRGKKWTDMDFPQEVKMKFLSYTMPVKVYTNKSDQEIAQIFVRVQEGLPLSWSEKLNAVLGYIRDEIKNLSEHKLLENTKISPHRFNRRWVVSHVVYHEINDFANTGFRRAYARDLMEMYIQHRKASGKTDKTLDQVKKVFDYLNKHLGNKAKLLEKNPDFITLYMVCSYLFHKGYIIEGVSGLNWGHFIEEFLLKVAEAKRKFKKLTEGQKMPEDLQSYYRYETNRRREGREEVKERFEFMIEEFLKMFPFVERKDPQRLFDEYQKRLIFKLADGRCQEPQDSKCAGKTDYASGEADHIKPWTKGGPTSVENGQWLCKHCNKVKSKKYLAS